MRQIFFLALGFAITGCSSALKIRVDVLYREALHKFPSFQRSQAEQLYQSLKAVWTDSAVSAQTLYIKTLVKKSILVDTSIAVADQDSIYTIIAKQVDSTFKVITIALEDFENLGPTAQAKSYQQAVARLRGAKEGFMLWKDGIKREVKSDTSILDEFFARKKQQLSLSDDDLLDDVLTSSVVHSPYKFWRQVKISKDFSELKYRNRQYKQRSAYSRTVVRTLLGNSDIAITMENKGHFTVKGVRLDAAKVAEATFKGLTQSIHFLALTTGAPVKKGDEEVTVLPELEELTTLKARQEATEKSFRQSALTLAYVVMRQEKALTESGEKKKTAINVLKSEVTAFKDQFKTNSNQE